MRQGTTSIYRGLLTTVLGASLLLVLPTLLLLATLHASSVIGGEAWMAASNKGAVPLVFGTTALEGVACLEQSARGAEEACTESWPTGTGILERQAARYRYYPDVAAIPDTDTIGEREADLRALRELLRSEARADGFVAMGDWVAQVVREPGSEGAVVRDVTELLLLRLKTAAAAEAELRTLDGDAFIAGRHLARPVRRAGRAGGGGSVPDRAHPRLSVALRGLPRGGRGTRLRGRGDARAAVDG